jgi:hypothetical protein
MRKFDVLICEFQMRLKEDPGAYRSVTTSPDPIFSLPESTPNMEEFIVHPIYGSSEDELEVNRIKKKRTRRSPSKSGKGSTTSKVFN